MSLTASDKAAVHSIWNKASQVSDLGTKIMDRLFTNYPQTKTLFGDMDLTPGSADMKAKGLKIVNVIGNAVSHMDDLAGNLSTDDLPTYKLMKDPNTSKMLSHSIQEVLKDHYPKEEILPLDTFLLLVARILISKNK